MNCKEKTVLHHGWEKMKRIYVRVSYTEDGKKQIRKLVGFGWICPICFNIILDEILPKLKGDYCKNKVEEYHNPFL